MSKILLKNTIAGIIREAGKKGVLNDTVYADVMVSLPYDEYTKFIDSLKQEGKIRENMDTLYWTDLEAQTMDAVNNCEV